MWWDSKLSLWDRRDVSIYEVLWIVTFLARGYYVVTDERTAVLVANHLKM